MKNKFKKGDIVTVEYKWGEEWKKGIGYIYNCGDILYVGVSCEDGGGTNILLSDLKNVKPVKMKTK